MIAAPTIETGRSFTSLVCWLPDDVDPSLETVGLPPLNTSLAKFDRPDAEKNDPSALSDSFTPVPNSTNVRPVAVTTPTFCRGGNPEWTPSLPCPSSLASCVVTLNCAP